MDGDELRSAALGRLKAKRDFQKGVVVYLLVNAFFVVLWFVGEDRGFFWPIWPIAGWGLAVGLQWWNAYHRKPISEEDIQREMGKGY